jgi:EmrB/QacA subfamily drug resistance transporter
MSLQSPGPTAAGPPGNRVVWVVILASIGAFITSLDVVAVSTALPSLQSHFHASLADLEWTLNGYNLAFAALMLTASALGDRYGKRTVYVAGLLLFVVASIACALADNAGLLISARVVQGIGAAGVLPLSLSLVSDAFPAEKRGAAIGIWGAITGLGVAAGPVLGGLIIQNLDWQWIFWINVPVGLVTAALTLVKVRQSYGDRPQLDLPGMGLAAAGLLLLVWAPVRAPSIGWDSGEVIGSLVLGAAVMAAFVLWERRAAVPMIPLAYFRNRGFATANGLAFFMALSLIGSLFMIAQMFQVGLGHNALQAGVRMLVWNGTPMIVAPIAGALSDRFGNKPFLVGGLLLQGAGLLWLAGEAHAGVSYGPLVGPLLVSGIGISCVFPTMANAVVSSVPMKDSGLASGANNTVREAGAVFGVAILAAVFAAYGGYESASAFMDGFKAAEVAAAIAAVVGACIAMAAPGRAAAGLPVREASALVPETA